MAIIPQADIPPKLEISSTFEMRYRFERRIDRDFDPAINDNRTDGFLRLRPGIMAKLGKAWSGAIQYQLANDETWTKARNFSDEASDLGLAYVKHSTSKHSITVGRQRISIGSERLFGPLDWAVAARSMDAIRIESGPFDIFAGRFSVAIPKPDRDALVAGTYRSPLGLTLVAFKHGEAAGTSVDHYTVSHAYKKSSGMFDLDVEGAVQMGAVNGMRHDAWALHAATGLRVAAKSKLTFELNAASGGSNPTKSKTFDNLYPTNHKFYGSMDLQGWRNMSEIAVGFEHKLNSKADIKVSSHSFWLRDPKDGWYGAGGAINRRSAGLFIDPSGMSGREIGHELDFESAYRLDAHTTFNAGLGVFTPGGFVKALSGNRQRQTWGYVSVSTKW